MTVFQTLCNHRVQENGQADAPQAPPADQATAMAMIEDHLRQCSCRFQLHLRGMARSGKSTLAAAADDVIQADGKGPTERSYSLLDQGLGIVHGEGTTPSPLSPSVARDPRQLEQLHYPRYGHKLMVVGFPQEPLGGMDRQRGVELYSNPDWTLVAVVWATRTHPDAARNSWFGLAGEMQRRSPEGTDPRKILAVTFQHAFNEADENAMSSYAADGLTELLQDDDLKDSRIRVSSRRGTFARISFDGLGTRSKKYEEILVEAAGKVVRVADKTCHNAAREVLQGLNDKAGDAPILYVPGWDFITRYDALYRQPDLEESIFEKFMGTSATRTNKNFFVQSAVSGRIKTGDDLGQVYVRDTVKDGPAALLAEFEARVARRLTLPVGGVGLERKPAHIKVSPSTSPRASAAPPTSPAPPVPPAPECPPEAQMVITAQEVPEAQMVITAQEEDACAVGDERRETVFRALQMMPPVFILQAGLWLAGVPLRPWLVTLGILALLVASAAYLWARFRSRHFAGSWICRSDHTVVLRRPVARTQKITLSQLAAEASPVERWLDTGRVYSEADRVRPWRIFRLARFEAAIGRRATRTPNPGFGAFATVALILTTLIRLFF